MRKCKCGNEYIQYNSMMTKCAECLVFDVRKREAKRVKAEKKVYKKETKERRDASQPKSHWIKHAQKSFNKWVKLRDHAEPCISCQKYRSETAVLNGSNFHAGHFKSVGARDELRFEPLNCHKQCAYCNTHLSGNESAYRVNLIKKIGLEKVDWLEGPHHIPHRTVDEIQAIKTKYAKLARELKKELEL